MVGGDRSGWATRERSASAVPHLSGAVLPGLVDAHVHLGLVQRADLAGGAVVEVHDLGWIPAAGPGLAG